MVNNDINDYSFSTDWFSHNVPALKNLLGSLKPQKILEIGSFEGRSTTFFIENCIAFHSQMEVHCIDSWEGGLEHIGRWDMNSVEQRFEQNISLLHRKVAEGITVNINKHKGYSHTEMIALLAKGYQNYFDFVYVDGSHEAPDVLFDALLAHRLVRVGGVIAFDDYLWSPKEMMEDDHYLLVKPAVDHYVNTYQRKLRVLQMQPLYQLYVQKLAD